MITTLKRIWEISKDRHPSIIKALVFSFLRSVVGVTQLFAIMIVINVCSGGGNGLNSLIYAIILTVLCVVGNYLTSYVEQTNTMRAGFYMTADERIRTGNKLRRYPLGFFNNNSMAKVTTVLTSSISNIESAGPLLMVGIISGIFNAFVLFVFMMFYHYITGLICGAGMVVYLLVVSWQMKVSEKNAPRLQKAQNNLSQSTLTFVNGIKVIKSFSFKKGDEQLKSAINSSCDENIKLTKISMPSQVVAGLVIAVSESLILAMSLVSHFIIGNADITKTVVLIIFSFMAYASLNQAGSMLAMTGLVNNAFDDIESVKKGEETKELIPVELPEDNSIKIENVSFSYGENQVLHDINLDIKPDTMTAIIGPSGSGKTTLCQLIARYYDIDSGRILIGNKDIKHIPYFELMKRISIVFQNVYLFEDTILNNIRFGVPDATLEQVREVAKKACCDDFIMKLEKGYDTVVTEGGSNLSGGEKQRISIARAMLKDSPIVILDEATSALDAENERDIIKAIDSLTKDKTVIMIAHRIATVKKADQIVVINNGTIEETGTDETLKNKEGTYKNFLEIRRKSDLWQIKNQ